MPQFETFVRNWWKVDAKGKLVPDTNGIKRNVTVHYSEQEARQYCRERNAEMDHGRLSRKYEYREI